MVGFERPYMRISLLHLLRAARCSRTCTGGPDVESRLGDGTADWISGSDRHEPAHSIELPLELAPRVASGKPQIDDEMRSLHLAAYCSAADDGQHLQWRAEGRVNGGRLGLSLHADPLGALQQDKSHRIAGELQAVYTEGR